MTNKQDSKTIEASDSDELLDDELAKVSGGTGAVGTIESPPDAGVGESATPGKVKTHEFVFVKQYEKSSP